MNQLTWIKVVWGIGVNVRHDQLLKPVHDCEFQTTSFFFGTGMIVVFLKQMGTSYWSRAVKNIQGYSYQLVYTGSENTARETPSGLVGFHRDNVRRAYPMSD